MAKKYFTDESLATFVNETKAYTDEAVATKANVIYGTCTTSGSYAQKQINVVEPASGWVLQTGTILYVKFTSTNTTDNPTLKLGTMEPKSVYYDGSVITTTNLSYAGYANRIISYMYDGTRFVFVGWSYDSNTDTKVTQVAPSSTNTDFPLILAGNSNTTNSYTGSVNKAKDLTYNPSTQTLTSPKFKGSLTGNASTATSATKATQDASGNVITSTYETKTAASTKLSTAKTYADNAVSALKSELLNGAGAAYDTLKELGDLIDDNQDAIGALETVAAGKADKEHSHTWHDIGTVTVYESDSIINGSENIADTMLIEGEIYTVVCDGVTYECVARNAGYDSIYIGNQLVPDGWGFPETIESNEPFFFATYVYDNWSIINIIDDSIKSIKITGPAKIDPKYIPDAELVQPDWNQNDETARDYVKNRTHYKTYGIIAQWDGDISKAADQTVYSFSDSATPFRYYLITPYEEIGLSTWDLEDSYYVYTSINETTAGLSCTDDYIVKGLIWGMVPGFVYTVKDNVAVNGITFGRAGLYLACNLTGGNVSEVGVVHYETLDPKYLPDEVTKQAGLKVEGTVYTIDGQSVTAGTGAEVFNDYSNNIASGDSSHAEGAYTTASGDYSHAEGFDTDATGYASHAEGGLTTASSDYTHAEGYKTTASGYASHAEGYSTTASKDYSHAEGYSTLASSNYQHVQGKNNIEDTSGTYAHIVGNGTSNSKRSNAHTLDWDGNAWFAGDVTGGTFISKGDASNEAQIQFYNNGSTSYDNRIYTSVDSDNHKEMHFEGAWVYILDNGTRVKSLCTGEKVEPTDGKTGATLSETGNLHLQGSSTLPSVYFYAGEGTTEANGRICMNTDDKMYFENAYAYRFDNGVIAKSICVGEKTTYNDGKTGINLTESGIMHIQHNNTPSIGFYVGEGTTSYNGRIYMKNDNYMYYEAAQHTFNSNIITTGGLGVCGKTSSSDGKIGVTIAYSGNIHVQSSSTPSLCFYVGEGTTTRNGRIHMQNDDVMYFDGASGGYTFDSAITSTNSSIYARLSFYSGNKSGTNDGKTGIVVGDNGNLYMQGVTQARIYFYTGTNTSPSANINVDTSGYMNFDSATQYRFDNPIVTSGNLYVGNGQGTTESTYGVLTSWKDTKNHLIVERGSDGLTASFGWAGSSSYATVAVIRGRTCKMTNSSGTTTLSDERLKKDFIELDKWEAFYDSLEPCAFKMKGGTSGRYHMGFKAQQVEQALLNNELTTQDFGGFIKTKYQPNEDDPEGNAVYEEAGIKEGDDEYGLIYTEFVALNTHMIKKLMNKIDKLEEEIACLKNQSV